MWYKRIQKTFFRILFTKYFWKSVLLEIINGSIIEFFRFLRISNSVEFYKIFSNINNIKNWYINCFGCRSCSFFCLLRYYQMFAWVNIYRSVFVEMVFKSSIKNFLSFMQESKDIVKLLFTNSFNVTCNTRLGMIVGTNRCRLSNVTMMIVACDNFIKTMFCRSPVWKALWKTNIFVIFMNVGEVRKWCLSLVDRIRFLCLLVLYGCQNVFFQGCFL